MGHSIHLKYSDVQERLENLMVDEDFNPADKSDWLRDLQAFVEECISELQNESEREEDE